MFLIMNFSQWKLSENGLLIIIFIYVQLILLTHILCILPKMYIMKIENSKRIRKYEFCYFAFYCATDLLVFAVGQVPQFGDY